MALYPDTDAIHGAVLALAATASIGGSPVNFPTVRRRLMRPEAIAKFPALLYEQLHDRWAGAPQKPPRLHLYAHIWIYAQTPTEDGASEPAQTLNPLKDAVIRALAPITPPNQTLGGLVTHVWIEGDVLFDEGLADQRGMVMIPVVILATT